MRGLDRLLAIPIQCAGAKREGRAVAGGQLPMGQSPVVTARGPRLALPGCVCGVAAEPWAHFYRRLENPSRGAQHTYGIGTNGTREETCVNAHYIQQWVGWMVPDGTATASNSGSVQLRQQKRGHVRKEALSNFY